VVIDPFRFAKKCEPLDRVIRLIPKGRLDGVILEESDISIHLNGQRNKQGRLTLIGQLSGSLKLQCQVCLENIDYPIDVSFDLVLVSSEEKADELTESEEALIIVDDQLELEDLIITELLLAMPVSPSHRNLNGTDCIDDDAFVSGEVEVEAEQSISPFDVLKNL